MEKVKEVEEVVQNNDDLNRLDAEAVQELNFVNKQRSVDVVPVVVPPPDALPVEVVQNNDDLNKIDSQIPPEVMNLIKNKQETTAMNFLN